MHYRVPLELVQGPVMAAAEELQYMIKKHTDYAGAQVTFDTDGSISFDVIVHLEEEADGL